MSQRVNVRLLMPPQRAAVCQTVSPSAWLTAAADRGVRTKPAASKRRQCADAHPPGSTGMPSTRSTRIDARARRRPGRPARWPPRGWPSIIGERQQRPPAALEEPGQLPSTRTHLSAPKARPGRTSPTPGQGNAAPYGLPSRQRPAPPRVVRLFGVDTAEVATQPVCRGDGELSAPNDSMVATLAPAGILERTEHLRASRTRPPQFPQQLSLIMTPCGSTAARLAMGRAASPVREAQRGTTARRRSVSAAGLGV